MHTWFSAPVRYPSFKLHSMQASLSSDAAACRSRSQESMNSFEYSRVAPKSTSSTYRTVVLAEHARRGGFGLPVVSGRSRESLTSSDRFAWP